MPPVASGYSFGDRAPAHRPPIFCCYVKRRSPVAQIGACMLSLHHCILDALLKAHKLLQLSHTVYCEVLTASFSLGLYTSSISCPTMQPLQATGNHSTFSILTLLALGKALLQDFATSDEPRYEVN